MYYLKISKRGYIWGFLFLFMYIFRHNYLKVFRTSWIFNHYTRRTIWLNDYFDITIRNKINMSWSFHVRKPTHFSVVQEYKYCIWCVQQYSRKSNNSKSFKDNFCYILFVELVEDLYCVFNIIHKKKPVYFHHFLFIGKSKFKTKRHVKAN